MKIIIDNNGIVNIQKTKHQGQYTNDYLELEFEFGDEWSDFNKYLEFEGSDLEKVAYLIDNAFYIPEDISKHLEVQCDIFFKKTENENTIQTPSQKWTMYFDPSINANPSIIEQKEDVIDELVTRVGDVEDDVVELSQEVAGLNIPTKTSQLENDSGFITKSVNDLDNYTTTDNMNTAISGAVGTETTNRQNADISLQQQIDAITSASDVVDVVSTYAELQNYDTSKLTVDDVIKVMQDSTHNNAISYFRWVITNNVGAWNYVGSEGPFYTKGETETILANYYNKSQVYNKTEIDGMIGDIETALNNLNQEAEAI